MDELSSARQSAGQRRARNRISFERKGADGFALPVAMKVFSPERFSTQAEYHEAMQRISMVASSVARIQHEGVLSVHDFIDRHRIRILIMDWIDGYDLKELLRSERLGRIRGRVPQRRWDYINNVIATAGPTHARLKAESLWPSFEIVWRPWMLSIART